MANILSAGQAILLAEILEPARLLSLIQSTNPKVFNLSAFDLISEYIYRSPRLPVFLWTNDLNTLINLPIAPEQITFEKSPKYEEIIIPGYHTAIPIFTGMDRKKISFTVYFDKSANSSFTDGGSGEILTYIPGIGCLDVIANIERLIYPMEQPRKDAKKVSINNVLGSAARNVAKPIVSYADPNSTDFYFDSETMFAGRNFDSETLNLMGNVFGGVNLAAKQTNFYPPPITYFFAGIRYWKCIVEKAAITELRFNKLMIPTHIEVQFTLGVLEEDSYYSEGGEIKSDGFYTQENLQRDFYSKVGSKFSVLDQVSYLVSTLART